MKATIVPTKLIKFRILLSSIASKHMYIKLYIKITEGIKIKQNFVLSKGIFNLLGNRVLIKKAIIDAHKEL